jgi:hypothetical protein
MAISILSAGGGFLLGAFTPSVGRKIKALFVKESSVVTKIAESKVPTVFGTIRKDL